MPDLRELLQLVGEYDKAISQSAYALLEALVEAVEPGDTELAEAKAELASCTASVNADAALGRLVRGMRRGSSLIHTGPFSTHKRDWGVHRVPGVYEWVDDPADALRSIQEEEGDAEV